MPQREQESQQPFLQGNAGIDIYVPHYPLDRDTALEITLDIEKELQQPEKLSPRAIYSMILTKNECSLILHRKSPLALADALRENFQLGLQTMLRTPSFNQQEHGQLREDFFQGYLQQLQIWQEHLSQVQTTQLPSSQE